MSYQSYRHYTVVVCDICRARGAAGDRDWREMGQNGVGEPIHLCPHCRPSAVWCEVHQCYHRPEDNHRQACATCGGLFTSMVKAQRVQCPSCQRAANPFGEPYSARSVPQRGSSRGSSRGWMSRLRAWMGG